MKEPEKPRVPNLTEEKLRRLVRAAFEDDLVETPEKTQRLVERALERLKEENRKPKAPRP